jgi:hypothetical protein
VKHLSLPSGSHSNLKSDLYQEGKRVSVRLTLPTSTFKAAASENCHHESETLPHRNWHSKSEAKTQKVKYTTQNVLPAYDR